MEFVKALMWTRVENLKSRRLSTAALKSSHFRSTPGCGLDVGGADMIGPCSIVVGVFIFVPGE